VTGIGLPPKLKEIPMSIRSIPFVAALSLTLLGAAQANGLRPIEGKSIDLGGVSGIAYYTVEPDGFHVVTTLAQGEVGTPIRIVSVLAPGQSVVLSTPNQADALEISRNGDSVLVRKATAVSR
jgi:hypothetical protein